MYCLTGRASPVSMQCSIAVNMPRSKSLTANNTFMCEGTSVEPSTLTCFNAFGIPASVAGVADGPAENVRLLRVVHEEQLTPRSRLVK